MTSCGEHTDYGLLTIIPPSYGAPGLELYNWTTGDWDQVERMHAGPDECTVMVGETLEKLSNKYLLTSIHRVVSLSG